MLSVFFWTFIFSIATAISIVLLGYRDLISGDLLNFKRFFQIIFDWRFIVAMIFALGARFSFIMTNNSLLKIPKLANSSTTITAFVTLFSMVLVVLANYLFLKERINVSQGFGATLILVGIWFMMK